MRSGKILHQFTAKDGRKVILRIPEWEDVDDPVELNNSIVDECVDIATIQKRLFAVRSIKRVGTHRRTRLSEKIDRYEDGGFKVD